MKTIPTEKKLQSALAILAKTSRKAFYSNHKRISSLLTELASLNAVKSYEYDAILLQIIFRCINLEEQLLESSLRGKKEMLKKIQRARAAIMFVYEAD